jgi:hypothetical protein
MLSMATNYWFEELQFPIGALNFSPLYTKKKKKHTYFEPMLPYQRRLVHFIFFKQKLSTFPLRQQRRRRKKKKEERERKTSC